MRKYKSAVALLLLLSMAVMIFVPAVAAAAPAVTAGSTDKASSGSGLFNILLGLLLGKLIGGLSGSSDSFDISKVLGVNTTTPADSGKGDGSIITTAKKYMGVPYVWGGETPSGFDCSGFTQYVMQERGITIPRTAAEQFSSGKSVDEANLQVGDMVFFTTYKPGASHVGFYMGDRQFIHASSAAGKVTTSSLDEEYYKTRYIGARRY